MLRKREEEELPEGIYGRCFSGLKPLSSSPEFKPRQSKSKLTRKAPSRPSGFPRPEIKQSVHVDVPHEATVDNGVEISEDVLHKLQLRTERRTAALSDLLLNDSVPSALSADYAFEYARAVLSSGFDLNVDVDASISESLTVLGRLDILVFFIRRMRMPRPFKHKFIEHILEHYSTHLVAELDKSLKKSDFRNGLRQVEAYVRSRTGSSAAQDKATPPDVENVGKGHVRAAKAKRR